MNGVVVIDENVTTVLVCNVQPGHRSAPGTLEQKKSASSATTGKNMLPCKIRLLDSNDFDTQFDVSLCSTYCILCFFWLVQLNAL